MRLHRLIIENFRGIKRLIWYPESGTTCLIGPGDSTKTTILDGINLVLTTRTAVKLSDADFYDGDIEAPIKIEVVLVDLPDELISLDNLGGYVCGVAPDGTVKADPEEDDQKALTIEFSADESLEPLWNIIKPDAPDFTPRHLTVSLRSKLGVFRVDEDVNTHLRWGRGSALAAITAGVAGATSTTVKAQRAARKAVFESDDPTLTEAATKVEEASKTFGATRFDELRVGLDPQSLNTGYGLVLHDGQIPITGHGLGTRRLISLGIQEARTVNASTILIDEIETGLEPHRLSHLLRFLKKRSETGTQVIMTTHAPLVVEFFGADGLAIVRKDNDGNVTIKQVPNELASLDTDAMQKMIRSGPSAMLAKQVLVLEGATEMGCFRTLFNYWDEEQFGAGKDPLAITGTAVRNGEGDELALKRAECLAELDFTTAVAIDSDKDLTTEVQAATEAGATVIRWGDNKHFEARVCTDLPEEHLKDLIEAAIKVGIEQNAIHNAISARLIGNPTLTGTDPTQWISTGISLQDIRNAIGEVAHRKGWFKVEQRGMELGELIHDLWTKVERTPLGQRIAEIRSFAYPTEEDVEEDVA